ncbi:MAG: zinc ribbon domain-containing protein [Chloroflexi bacterium]|nr:zinc ribbon domain-containing protein [Chloroflexota bacterium]
MIICPNCGQRNKNGSKFCNECGDNLVGIIPSPPLELPEQDRANLSLISLEKPEDTAEQRLPALLDPLGEIKQALPVSRAVALPRRIVVPEAPSTSLAEMERSRLLSEIARTYPRNPGAGLPRHAIASPLVRWVVGIVIVAAVGIPLVFPHLFNAQPVPSAGTSAAFQSIDNLLPGSTVLLSFDYDAGAAAEMEPLALALARHVELRSAHLIVMSLNPQGQALADRVLQQLQQNPGPTPAAGASASPTRLGYLPGNEAALRNLPQMLAPESRGAATPSIQRAIILGSSAQVVRWWVEQYGTSQHVPLIAAVSAAAEPDLWPYYQSGQLTGLTSGQNGAASYERLLGLPGNAMANSESLTIGLVVIAALILLGNLAGNFLGGSRL